jgi:hypothetical protein
LPSLKPAQEHKFNTKTVQTHEKRKGKETQQKINGSNKKINIGEVLG